MDKVKEQLQEVTKILDPYANQIGFVVKAAENACVNSGLILAGMLFSVGLVLMLLQGW